MAYCPLAQGHIPRKPVLKRIAERHRATPAQIMLAWVLRHEHADRDPEILAAGARARERRGGGHRPVGRGPDGPRPRIPAAAQVAAAGHVLRAWTSRTGGPGNFGRSA